MASYNSIQHQHSVNMNLMLHTFISDSYQMFQRELISEFVKINYEVKKGNIFSRLVATKREIK